MTTIYWLQLREQILKRDNYTCQRCGAIRPNIQKRGRNLTLDVHHIISRRNGGSDNISNLKTLCSGTCHNIEESLSKKKRLIRNIFRLTPETDEALRIIAIKEKKKFSVVAEEAFSDYIKRKKKS